MSDLYAVLGLTPEATRDDIKKAWLILSKKYHPDRPDGDAGRMAEINNAKEILLDSELRASYDTHGRAFRNRVEIEAGDELAALFNQWLADPTNHVNPVDWVIGQLHDDLSKDKQQLQRGKKAMGLYEKMQGKVKSTSDHNLFDFFLEKRLEETEQGIRQVEHQIERGEKALEMAQEYWFTEPERVQQYAASLLGGLANT